MLNSSIVGNVLTYNSLTYMVFSSIFTNFSFYNNKNDTQSLTKIVISCDVNTYNVTVHKFDQMCVEIVLT